LVGEELVLRMARSVAPPAVGVSVREGARACEPTGRFVCAKFNVNFVLRVAGIAAAVHWRLHKMKQLKGIIFQQWNRLLESGLIWRSLNCLRLLNCC
jgi:hypothetical protein